MKILCVGIFYPSVGGMERMLEVVAGELSMRGHDVHVVSGAPRPRPDQMRHFRHRVTWLPSARRMFALQRWADVALHFGIGLRLGWPAIFVRTPQVVSHQFPYEIAGPKKRGRELFKNWLTRHVVNISASQAVADTIPGASTVVPNCYDEAVFTQHTEVLRDRDLVFVGRLVSLKGVDLLLAAIREGNTAGPPPRLTIIGDGPERAALQREAQPLGDRVTFVGARTPEEIAALLRRHRVLVVPSRWDEPFGIVALEGIACGCIVVGSSGGGLRDAIGPCGLTFPNGNVAALSRGITRALEDDALLQQTRAAAPAHLRRHTSAAVVDRYEAVMQGIVAARRTVGKCA